MSAKPKIAFYWCASCGGCEETVVDLAEEIIGVLEAVEFVFWPCAMDFKRADVEALPDRSIAATFLNGAIRSDEQAEMAHLLRRKSRCLVAYGACAQLGGIPALANLFSREELLRGVYEESPTTCNETGIRPQPESGTNGHRLTLPSLRNLVRALDQVTPVDYYVPGCPPSPKLTQAAVAAILSENPPPSGSVLAPELALCDQCPRKSTKPLDHAFKEFRRPHLVQLDPDQCFLAQGIVCLGPATRSGCESACICGGMPCSGCFGPTPRVRDQGAKILSALSASVSAQDPNEIATVLAGIPDPAGTFYRYGLAKSTLRRKVNLCDAGPNLPADA